MDDIVRNEAEAEAFVEGLDPALDAPLNEDNDWPTEVTTPESAEKIEEAALGEAAASLDGELATDTAEWTRAEEQSRNIQKLQILAQMGVDVNSLILTTRVEHLVELLLPELDEAGEESEARSAFDDQFELKLGVALDSTAAQVRENLTRQKLLIANEQPPDLAGRLRSI